ncbi:MAG TPA: efflux RND transporter permease subunit [Methylomirabilota bacterium]
MLVSAGPSRPCSPRFPLERRPSRSCSTPELDSRHAAQSYGSFWRVGGKPAALIGIFQLPGANALDVSKGVIAAVARLAPSFSSGVTHTRPYNTTEFVRVSIEEVVLTLLIAIGLVVLTG